MNKLILVLALFLTGCGSFKDMLCGPPPPPVDNVIRVDPKLLEPCQPLHLMEKPTPGFEDYLSLQGENVIVYVDCKKKQEASILFIKKVANGSK